MKRVYSIALAALLAFGLFASQPEAKAADRVLKHVKTCKYEITTAIHAAADAVLAQADGSTYCDVSDMVVERVVIESNITTLTGTDIVFEAITTSDPANAGATTDPALLGSDGSTALELTVNATGRKSVGTSVPVVGTSGVGTNMGKKIGLRSDENCTASVGFVYLTIFGRM